MRILTSGIDQLEKRKFDQIKNNSNIAILNKPYGGLYGSTYLPDKEYKSDWLKFVSSTNFQVNKYNKCISYTLKNNTKICTIASLEDYKKLLNYYSTTYGKISNDNLFISDIILLDWEALSKDYDAFHLTKNGFLETEILMDISFQGLYSHHCESWIIFNYDCINQGSIVNHKFNYKEEELW